VFQETLLIVTPLVLAFMGGGLWALSKNVRELRDLILSEEEPKLPVYSVQYGGNNAPTHIPIDSSTTIKKIKRARRTEEQRAKQSIARKKWWDDKRAREKVAFDALTAPHIKPTS
jgi:hypothetical protein